MEIRDAGNLSEAARRLKMTRGNFSLEWLDWAVGAQLLRRAGHCVEATELAPRCHSRRR